MIKIGLIGAGFMGETHAACYAALQGQFNFQVVAVADDDPVKAQKMADAFGAKVYATGEQLIEHADVNTIDICLPTFLHTAHALLAMRKGYDVFIEKPVCLHETEAESLLAAQQEFGVRVMVGQCIRFWPEYQYLKTAISQNLFGAMVSAVFTRISPRPGWAWQQWLHDPEKSGSVALDLHIHDVDFVRYAWGTPDEIASEVIRKEATIEHIYSTYRYGEQVVSLEASWDYPAGFPFEMAYRVKFAEATVVYSNTHAPTLTVYGNDGSGHSPELTQEADGQSGQSSGNINSLGGYLNELRYFLEQLVSGSPIGNATLEDGVESFRLAKRVIEATRKSQKAEGGF